MTTIGFNRPLYILPFDHRASFQNKLFRWSGALTIDQTAQIAAAKQVIYEGFRAALEARVPKQKAGILVDEQFGAAILHHARANGYTTACPAEKSGQEDFDFEYGEDFAKHIEACQPTFCKVLVRYNPEGDQTVNARQVARLKRLSEYLHGKSRSLFMFELLVPPEKTQLARLNGIKKRMISNLVPGTWLRRSRNYSTRELNRTSGRSKDLTVERIARKLPPPPAGVTVTKSAVLSWGAARTTRRCVNGWRRRLESQGSSASQWAVRVFGIHS